MLRKCWKSFNLSLLKYFFELQVDGNGKPKFNSSNYKLFEKLKRAKLKEIYDKYFNQYPVIKIDFTCNLPLWYFNDVVSECWVVVRRIYFKHKYLLHSSILTADNRNYCELWMSLTRCKSFHFDGRKCCILIKEYNSICLNAVFSIINDDNINRSIKFITRIFNSVIRSNDVKAAKLPLGVLYTAAKECVYSSQDGLTSSCRSHLGFTGRFLCSPVSSTYVLKL